MALNLVSLIPNLFNVQKVLEDYTLKYGSVIYYDPSDASSEIKKAPSITQNQSTVKSIAEFLLNYYYTKTAIGDSQYNSKVYSATVYFGLVLTILLIILILAVCWMGGAPFKEVNNYFNSGIQGKDFLSNLKKGIGKFLFCTFYEVFKNNFDFGERPITDICIYFSICAIIVLSICFGIYYSIKIWWYSLQTYKRIYNISPIETGNIINTINMFHVKGASDRQITLEQYDPATAFFYAKNNPNVNVVHRGKKSICDSTGKNITGFIAKNNSKTFPEFAAQECKNTNYTYNKEKTLFPFTIANDASKIDPFLLKQEIQRFDLFGQLSRLSEAINWTESFMLRSRDQVYSTIGLTITAKARKELQGKIADLILNSGAIVKDIRTPNYSVQRSKSPCDCFSAALDSDLYVAASYNLTNSNCKLVSRKDNQAGSARGLLLYAGSNTSEMTMLIGNGNDGNVGISSSSAVVASSDSMTVACSSNVANCVTLGNSSSNTYFTTDPYGKALAADPYDDHANYTIWPNSSNLVAEKNRTGGIAQFISTMKPWLVSSITDKIILVDTTNTFNMNADDVAQIVSVIQNAVGLNWATISGDLTDILTQVQFELAKKRLDKTASSGKNKYIPFERFKEKVQALDSRTFVTQMLYFTNEIRATSDGIANLNDTYGLGKLENSFYKDCRDKGMDWLMILTFLGGVGSIAYFVRLYVEKKNTRKDKGGKKNTDNGVCLGELQKIVEALEREVTPVAASSTTRVTGDPRGEGAQFSVPGVTNAALPDDTGSLKNSDPNNAQKSADSLSTDLKALAEVTKDDVQNKLDGQSDTMKGNVIASDTQHSEQKPTVTRNGEPVAAEQEVAHGSASVETTQGGQKPMWPRLVTNGDAKQEGGILNMFSSPTLETAIADVQRDVLALQKAAKTTVIETAFAYTDASINKLINGDILTENNVKHLDFDFVNKYSNFISYETIEKYNDLLQENGKIEFNKKSASRNLILKNLAKTEKILKTQKDAYKNLTPGQIKTLETLKTQKDAHEAYEAANNLVKKSNEQNVEAFKDILYLTATLFDLKFIYENDFKEQIKSFDTNVKFVTEPYTHMQNLFSENIILYAGFKDIQNAIEDELVLFEKLRDPEAADIKAAINAKLIINKLNAEKGSKTFTADEIKSKGGDLFKSIENYSNETTGDVGATGVVGATGLTGPAGAVDATGLTGPAGDADAVRAQDTAKTTPVDSVSKKIWAKNKVLQLVQPTEKILKKLYEEDKEFFDLKKSTKLVDNGKNIEISELQYKNALAINNGFGFEDDVIQSSLIQKDAKVLKAFETFLNAAKENIDKFKHKETFSELKKAVEKVLKSIDIAIKAAEKADMAAKKIKDEIAATASKEDLQSMFKKQIKLEKELKEAIEKANSAAVKAEQVIASSKQSSKESKDQRMLQEMKTNIQAATAEAAKATRLASAAKEDAAAAAATAAATMSTTKAPQAEITTLGAQAAAAPKTQADDNEPLDMDLVTELCIQISLTISALLIIYFLLRVVNNKKNVLMEFNQSQMDANSTKLKNAAANSIQILYDDLVTHNHYGIQSNTPINGFEVVDANIVINASTPGTAVPEIKQMFNKIASRTLINSSIIVKVSNQASLEAIYNNYVTILDAYANCNSLFALQSERMPFPIVEIILFSMILLISLYALYLVVNQFEPKENWENYDFVTRCLNTTEVMNATDDKKFEALGEQDKTFVKEIVQKHRILDSEAGEPREAEANKMRKAGIKIIGCAIMVTVVGLFISVLENNATSYQTSLYTNFGSSGDCAPP